MEYAKGKKSPRTSDKKCNTINKKERLQTTTKNPLN